MSDACKLYEFDAICHHPTKFDGASPFYIQFAKRDKTFRKSSGILAKSRTISCFASEPKQVGRGMFANFVARLQIQLQSAGSLC